MNFAAAAVAAAIPKLLNKNLNPKPSFAEFTLKLHSYLDQPLETLKFQGSSMMLQLRMMQEVENSLEIKSHLSKLHGSKQFHFYEGLLN